MGLFSELEETFHSGRDESLEGPKTRLRGRDRRREDRQLWGLSSNLQERWDSLVWGATVGKWQHGLDSRCTLKEVTIGFAYITRNGASGEGDATRVLGLRS